LKLVINVQSGKSDNVFTRTTGRSVKCSTIGIRSVERAPAAIIARVMIAAVNLTGISAHKAMKKKVVMFLCAAWAAEAVT